MSAPNFFQPNFAATGIGSLPHIDANSAVEVIINHFALMPYWPQLPVRSPIEQINFQYANALTPLIKANLDKKTLFLHPNMSREEALTAFYKRLLESPLYDFALKPEEAAGFFAFLEKIERAPTELFPWIKGHITGPLTLAAAVKDINGKAILYDDEIAEAIARGLGVATAAQIVQLAASGRPVIIFVDEPILSSYGSAFTSISRKKILYLLGLCLEECRQRTSAIIGIHCCGNTDWGILVEVGFDIISLDSVEFGTNLLLYHQALKTFYEGGGTIAWGAVPTTLTTYNTAYSLWNTLKSLLNNLISKGFDQAMITSQALVTPACGLGSLSETQASNRLKLTKQISELARSEFKL